MYMCVHIPYTLQPHTSQSHTYIHTLIHTVSEKELLGCVSYNENSTALEANYILNIRPNKRVGLK